MDEELRIIISGGGTGGHIFPAVSIANAIRRKRPGAKILFVGAEGRMEMQRVPAAGYEIKGLPICGFDRKNMLRNVKVLFKIWKSQRMAKQIIRQFRPMAAVGVGGYASGPTLNKCAAMGIPCLIQEQNSYAGVTNKLLARTADKICVAYEGMERFFPVVLIIGGSLAARTINESVLANLGVIAESGIQFVWQTGSFYHDEIKRTLDEKGCPANLKPTDFISSMDVAYRAADLVISRAGASSISELCLLGKPSILVPSPNVAEDHQTHNAMALVNKQAAMMVRDDEARQELIPLAVETLTSADRKYVTLGENAAKMALPNSADIIADEVIKLASGK